MTELIGWASSALLIFTICRQVYKQWREGTSKGVSKWLYIGQMGTSAGFTVYSALLRNPVFVVTNTMLFVTALVGFGIYRHHQRRDERAAA